MVRLRLHAIASVWNEIGAPIAYLRIRPQGRRLRFEFTLPRGGLRDRMEQTLAQLARQSREAKEAEVNS
jgi:hypothetical protein